MTASRTRFRVVKALLLFNTLPPPEFRVITARNSKVHSHPQTHALDIIPAEVHVLLLGGGPAMRGFRSP